MKIVFLALLLPIGCLAQQMTLVDRNYKVPMQATRTFSIEQLLNRQFAVYQNDIDKIVGALEQCVAFLSRPATTPHERRFTAGHSHVVLNRQKQHRQSHSVSLYTDTGVLTASMLLVSKYDSRKEALRKLTIFIDYLRNNGAVLETAAPQRS